MADSTLVPPSFPEWLGPAPGRSVVGAVGVLVAAAGLVGPAVPVLAVESIAPAVGAVLVVGLWVVVPAPYAVAVGQLAVLAALPVSPPRLIAVEAGLVLVLVGTATAGSGWARDLLVTLVAIGLAVGVVLAGLALPASPPVVAGLLVGTGGLIGYGIHRYERVELGLVES